MKRLFEVWTFTIIAVIVISGMLAVFYAQHIHNEREISIQDGNNRNDGESEDDGTDGTGSQDVFLTCDEINSLENLSVSDKLTALAIISKLGKEDIETVYNMLDGGITFEEMNVIRKRLEKKLSGDEIETLEEIINRNMEN